MSPPRRRLAGRILASLAAALALARGPDGTFFRTPIASDVLARAFRRYEDLMFGNATACRARAPDGP